MTTDQKFGLATLIIVSLIIGYLVGNMNATCTTNKFIIDAETSK